MRKRFVLLALLLPAIGACSSDSANDASAAPAAPPAATTPTTLAVTTDVAPTLDADSIPADAGAVGIADFTFTPATIDVPIGGSVVWTNDDAQQHTATSAGNFDSDAIQPGGSATVAFETAGTFAYICAFHPFMTGTVVVG